MKLIQEPFGADVGLPKHLRPVNLIYMATVYEPVAARIPDNSTDLNRTHESCWPPWQFAHTA